jgi:hypothetical protein
MVGAGETTSMASENPKAKAAAEDVLQFDPMADELDLSDVESSGGLKPLPNGTYLCRVDQVDPGRTSSNGNRMIDVTFVVIDPESYQGRRIWHHITFTQKSLGIAKQQLEAILGHSISKVIFSEVAEDMLDREVKVRVDIERSEGYSDRNRIRGLIPVGGSQDAAPGRDAVSRSKLFNR